MLYNMLGRHRSARWAVLVFVMALLGGAPPAVSQLIPISGTSPYPDGGDPTDPMAVTACNGGDQRVGVLYRNSESEPYIAVNPTDPNNMIACWHQDRWSNGSAQGVGTAYTFDGGANWTWVNIPFTNCSGGAPGTGGDYERASDPWLSFGPTGEAYYMALVSDRSTSRNGMAMAKSVDGGVTWSTPIIIKSNNSIGIKARSHFHDKNTLTADPHDPNLVYATWSLFRNGIWALLVSRSTDGGMTWGPARPVNKVESVTPHLKAVFRQGAQIVVLPDEHKTILNVFYRLLSDARGGRSFVAIEMAMFRSRDQGKHWEKLDTPISGRFGIVPTGGFDVERQIFVRDAGTLPDIAVDQNNGNIYVVWQDGRYSEFGASTIAMVVSTDGGDTWTEPFPVTEATNPGSQEFLPAVAVAEDGTVGVLYYDFRHDEFGVDQVLSTDVYLKLLDPTTLSELDDIRLTPESFDMRQMVITGERGYFPGDYVGLDAAGNDFVAAFTVANNLDLPVDFPQAPTDFRVDGFNRQDIVFARVTRGPAPATAGTLAKGGGGVNTSSVKLPVPKATDDYALRANVPNPFNPTTTISFDLPVAGSVHLDIFDVKGRLVRTLAHGETYPAGSHELQWNGRNDSGRFVASGVYLYRFSSGTFVDTRRMVLMK